MANLAHTTLNRRAATLEVPRPQRWPSAAAASDGEPEPLHLPGLRSHKDACRATVVAVAVHALNRVLELRRPTYVRIV